MDIVIYDGSYAGFFTAVFEIYEYKLSHLHIVKKSAATGTLLGVTHTVFTNLQKAQRVLWKLQSIISADSLLKLRACFLSDEPGAENTLLGYIQYVIHHAKGAERNMAHAQVLKVEQIARKVGREAHRMKAFVRFQLSQDGIYAAVVAPDHNVLPLIARHFKNRYADQRWMIYDTKRNYGIYYNLQTVTEIHIDSNAAPQSANTLSIAIDEKELLYQQLWKTYFKSTNNVARKNTRLHVQFLPKRYWKYLTEKSFGEMQ